MRKHNFTEPSLHKGLLLSTWSLAKSFLVVALIIPTICVGSPPPKTIVFLGDSNTEIGHITGALNKVFFAEFGDQGTGFYSLNKHIVTPKPSQFNIEWFGIWQEYDMRNEKILPPPYLSPNGMWLQSSVPNSKVEIAFSYPVIDLYYGGKEGENGLFDIIVDNHKFRSVKVAETGINKLTIKHLASNTTHTLQLIVRAGTVVLAGVDAKPEDLVQRAVVHNWGNAWAATQDFATIDAKVMETAILNLEPDIVAIMLGTNDHGLDKRSASAVQSNLEQLINTLANAIDRKQIVLLSTVQTSTGTNAHLLTEYLTKAFPQAAMNQQVFYWDMSSWLGPYNSRYMADGVHVNVLGGELIATEFLQQIQKLFATQLR